MTKTRTMLIPSVNKILGNISKHRANNDRFALWASFYNYKSITIRWSLIEDEAMDSIAAISRPLQQ